MWFAVRHVIYTGRAYEERITLWEAASFASAIKLAEEEARAYTSLDPSWRLLDLFQAFDLDNTAPGSGSEVFSLIRESDLEPSAYIERFFATGSELQEDL